MASLARRPPVRRGARSAAAIRSVVEDLELIYGVARRRIRFDPLEELVSCILSQHSSDKATFPAFTQLRSTYADWQDVVDAGPERLAITIKNAGLANQKSKSIINCLTAIEREVGGYSLEFLRPMSTPEAMTWLMKLPGVGPKTASIVLCFSFGRDTIPVDTHVFRVTKRLGIVGAEENELKAHDTIAHVVPPDLAYRFHAALIQHGRNLCKAPTPECEPCILKDRCLWFKNG